MTNLIHIIDTASITEGDLVAFATDNGEITGIVEDINDDGEFVVDAICGTINVAPHQITDIC